MPIPKTDISLANRVYRWKQGMGVNADPYPKSTSSTTYSSPSNISLRDLYETGSSVSYNATTDDSSIVNGTTSYSLGNWGSYSFTTLDNGSYGGFTSPNIMPTQGQFVFGNFRDRLCFATDGIATNKDAYLSYISRCNISGTDTRCSVSLMRITWPDSDKAYDSIDNMGSSTSTTNQYLIHNDVVTCDMTYVFDDSSYIYYTAFVRDSADSDKAKANIVRQTKNGTATVATGSWVEIPVQSTNSNRGVVLAKCFVIDTPMGFSRRGGSGEYYEIFMMNRSGLSFSTTNSTNHCIQMDVDALNVPLNTAQRLDYTLNEHGIRSFLGSSDIIDGAYVQLTGRTGVNSMGSSVVVKPMRYEHNTTFTNAKIVDYSGVKGNQSLTSPDGSGTLGNTCIQYLGTSGNNGYYAVILYTMTTTNFRKGPYWRIFKWGTSGSSMTDVSGSWATFSNFYYNSSSTDILNRSQESLYLYTDSSYNYFIHNVTYEETYLLYRWSSASDSVLQQVNGSSEIDFKKETTGVSPNYIRMRTISSVIGIANFASTGGQPAVFSWQVPNESSEIKYVYNFLS